MSPGLYQRYACLAVPWTKSKIEAARNKKECAQGRARSSCQAPLGLEQLSAECRPILVLIHEELVEQTPAEGSERNKFTSASRLAWVGPYWHCVRHEDSPP